MVWKSVSYIWIMKKTNVDSSMLSSVGYDEEKQILEAEFTSGKVYQYYDVPKDVFEELMQARSVGGYFRGSVLGCYADLEVKRRWFNPSPQ